MNNLFLDFVKKKHLKTEKVNNNKSAKIKNFEDLGFIKKKKRKSTLSLQ